MTLRSIILISCCLSLTGCAVGPRGPGFFGAIAFGAAIGSVWTVLPHRYVVVDHHTYYSDGVFYRDSPNGYKVIAPSLGMRVDDIPQNHNAIRHKEQDYVKAKGVWYQFDVEREQYIVVANPIDGPIEETDNEDDQIE